jgi:hypothetical protein
MVVVELLSENNWATPSNEIAFSSSNAEDGKKKRKSKEGWDFIYLSIEILSYI